MWDIIILPHFKRCLKPLVKKHRDLFDQVVLSLKEFDEGIATKIIEKVYKIRISPKSLKKGKSRALRLYVLALEVNNQLVPVTIYAKSDKQNLSKRELDMHLEIILTELTSSKDT